MFRGIHSLESHFRIAVLITFVKKYVEKTSLLYVGTTAPILFVKYKISGMIGKGLIAVRLTSCQTSTTGAKPGTRRQPNIFYPHLPYSHIKQQWEGLFFCFVFNDLLIFFLFFKKIINCGKIFYSTAHKLPFSIPGRLAYGAAYNWNWVRGVLCEKDCKKEGEQKLSSPLLILLHSIF